MSSCEENAAAGDASTKRHDANATSASMGDSGIIGGGGGIGNVTEKSKNMKFNVTTFDANVKICENIENNNNSMCNEKDATASDDDDDDSATQMNSATTSTSTLKQQQKQQRQQQYDAYGIKFKEINATKTCLHENTSVVQINKRKEQLLESTTTATSNAALRILGNTTGLTTKTIKNLQNSTVEATAASSPSPHSSQKHNKASQKILSVPKIMITSPPNDDDDNDNNDEGRCSKNMSKILDTSKTIEENNDKERQQRLEDVKRMLNNQILIRKINPNAKQQTAVPHKQIVATSSSSSLTQLHHQHQPFQTTNLLLPPNAKIITRKRNISPASIIIKTTTSASASAPASSSATTTTTASTTIPTIKVRKLHTIANASIAFGQNQQQQQKQQQSIFLPTNSPMMNSSSCSSSTPKQSQQLSTVRFPVIRPISFSSSHQLPAGAIIRPLRGTTPLVTKRTLSSAVDFKPTTVQYRNYYPVITQKSCYAQNICEITDKSNNDSNSDTDTESQKINSPSPQQPSSEQTTIIKLPLKAKANEVPIVDSNVMIKTPVVQVLNTTDLLKDQSKAENNNKLTSSSSSIMSPKSKTHQNCAFILENKILNPDEKIDLTQLRFENAKITDKHLRLTMPYPLPLDEIKKEKPEEVESQSSTSSTPVVKKRRLIVSNAKLKLTSKDDIAAMAKKVIQNATMKNTKEAATATTATSATLATTASVKSSKSLTQIVNCGETIKPIKKETYISFCNKKQTNTHILNESIHSKIAKAFVPEPKPKPTTVNEIKKEMDMGCSSYSKTNVVDEPFIKTPTEQVKHQTKFNLSRPNSSSTTTKSVESIENLIIKEKSPFKQTESKITNKNSLPKASLEFNTSIPPANANDSKSRHKVLSFCDKEYYSTIEVVDVEDDEDEEEDEFDAVDFIASLTSFGQNPTQSFAAEKSSETSVDVNVNEKVGVVVTVSDGNAQQATERISPDEGNEKPRVVVTENNSKAQQQQQPTEKGPPEAVVEYPKVATENNNSKAQQQQPIEKELPNAIDENATVANEDNSKAQQPIEKKLPNAVDENPKVATEDNSKAQQPTEKELPNAVDEKPKVATEDNSKTTQPKEKEPTKVVNEKPREVTEDNSKTQQPIEKELPNAVYENPKVATESISKTKTPAQNEQQIIASSEQPTLETLPKKIKSTNPNQTENKAPNEVDTLCKVLSTAETEKRYDSDLKQAQDESTKAKVVSLESSKTQKQVIETAAASNILSSNVSKECTKNLSAQDECNNKIKTIDTTVKPTIVSQISKATSDETKPPAPPTIMTAPRKRIGLRNAPINLVSRKKPIASIIKKFKTSDTVDTAGVAVLSTNEKLTTTTSEEEKSNRNQQEEEENLMQIKQKEESQNQKLDLNVNVIKNTLNTTSNQTPNPTQTPTVINVASTSDIVEESLKNVLIKPLLTNANASVSLNEDILEVETMQNDLDILATLSVAQKPLSVEPKSTQHNVASGGVPALGTIIDMKAYGLEQRNFNTEIIIKNDKKNTSKQVSVVMLSDTPPRNDKIEATRRRRRVMNDENVDALSKRKEFGEDADAQAIALKNELTELNVAVNQPILIASQDTKDFSNISFTSVESSCEKMQKAYLEEKVSPKKPKDEEKAVTSNKSQAIATTNVLDGKEKINLKKNSQQPSKDDDDDDQNDDDHNDEDHNVDETNSTLIPCIRNLNKTSASTDDVLMKTTAPTTTTFSSEKTKIASKIECTRATKLSDDSKNCESMQNKSLKKRLQSPPKKIIAKRRCLKSSSIPSKATNLSSNCYQDNNLKKHSQYIKMHDETKEDVVVDKANANAQIVSKLNTTVTCSSDEIIPCSISDSSDSKLNLSFLNRRRLYRKRRGVPEIFSTSESEVEENMPTTTAAAVKEKSPLIVTVSETSSDDDCGMEANQADSTMATMELISKSESREKLETQFASPFVPLKKRWEQQSQQQQKQKRSQDETTDITDDTSPVDDEDEDNMEYGNDNKVKQKKVMTIDANFLITEDSIATKVEGTKRRGRPIKKDITLNQQKIDSNVDNSLPIDDKQKSSKPNAKKVKPNEINNDECIEKSKTENTKKISVVTSKEIADLSAKQQQGKKSKQKDDQLSQKIEKSEVSSIVKMPKMLATQNQSGTSTTTVPKKRGRPRKSQVVMTESADCNQATTTIGGGHITRPCLEEGKELILNSTLKSISSRSSLSPPEEYIVEKKRARKSLKTLPVTNTEDSNNETFSTQKATIVSSTPKSSATKTRRNRGQVNVGDFNPRMLLMRRREQLNSDEILTVPENAAGTGPLQCGLCLARTTRDNWQKHIAEHYGVGWVIGENSPVDVTTRNTVLSKVQAFFKNSNITSLSCRLCQRTYRSYLGVILHLESCGEAPQRVVCTLCGHNYTKLSMIVHQRSCTGPKQTTIKVEEEMCLNETEIENVQSIDGRVKRVSSIKAEKKLKTLTQDLSQPESYFDPKHYIKRLENIDAKVQQSIVAFVCTLCAEATHFTSLPAATEHVKNQHKSVISNAPTAAAEALDFESDGSDYKCVDTVDEDESEDCTSGMASSSMEMENEFKSPGKHCSSKKKMKQQHSLSVYKYQTTYHKIYSPRCSDVPALTQKMWREFIHKNYVETKLLFEKFLPKIEIVNISNDALEKILPSDKGSMKFTMPRKLKMFTKFGESVSGTLEWQSLQRFQDAIGTANDKLVYLGAPIKLLRWIPLPSNIQEQYLVIAYRKSSSASSFVRLLNARPKQTLLLIYKLTKMNNCLQSELHYGFYIPDGPVHTLAFLPSGGYDSSKNRLGLIAVGGAQSAIRVYSMPIEPTIESNVKKSANIRVIRLPIAFELVLNLEMHNDDVETQCMDISWSEFLGHEHIFASFSNGYIAVWKIHEPRMGALNVYYCERENGSRCYTPENYFSFEEGKICGLAIHYDTYGPRWLLAYATSRNLCVFDIRDKSQPLTIKEECLKHVPRCIDWSPIWETFSVGTCDIMPNYGRVLSMYNPLGVNFMHLSLAHSLAGISQVHFNPWQSLTLFATDNGDLCCAESSELNVDFKKSKRGMALSLIDMKRLDSNELLVTGSGIPKVSNVSYPIVDKASKEQEKSYGIVFSTFSKLQEKETKMLRDGKRKPPSNLERHTRINDVRWNLNAKGKTLLAVGYENGFLRFCSFKKDEYFD